MKGVGGFCFVPVLFVSFRGEREGGANAKRKRTKKPLSFSVYSRTRETILLPIKGVSFSPGTVGTRTAGDDPPPPLKADFVGFQMATLVERNATARRINACTALLTIPIDTETLRNIVWALHRSSVRRSAELPASRIVVSTHGRLPPRRWAHVCARCAHTPTPCAALLAPEAFSVEVEADDPGPNDALPYVDISLPRGGEGGAAAFRALLLPSPTNPSTDGGVRVRVEQRGRFLLADTPAVAARWSPVVFAYRALRQPLLLAARNPSDTAWVHASWSTVLEALRHGPRRECRFGGTDLFLCAPAPRDPTDLAVLLFLQRLVSRAPAWTPTVPGAPPPPEAIADAHDATWEIGLEDVSLPPSPSLRRRALRTLRKRGQGPLAARLAPRDRPCRSYAVGLPRNTEWFAGDAKAAAELAHLHQGGGAVHLPVPLQGWFERACASSTPGEACVGSSAPHGYLQTVWTPHASSPPWEAHVATVAQAVDARTTVPTTPELLARLGSAACAWDGPPERAGTLTWQANVDAKALFATTPPPTSLEVLFTGEWPVVDAVVRGSYEVRCCVEVA